MCALIELILQTVTGFHIS